MDLNTYCTDELSTYIYGPLKSFYSDEQIVSIAKTLLSPYREWTVDGNVLKITFEHNLRKLILRVYLDENTRYSDFRKQIIVFTHTAYQFGSKSITVDHNRALTNATNMMNDVYEHFDASLRQKKAILYKKIPSTGAIKYIFTFIYPFIAF